MAITLKFFGPLRKFADTVALEIEPGCELTLAELRARLESEIETAGRNSLAALLEVSAFADENQILTGDARVKDSTVLFLLPPVCGG